MVKHIIVALVMIIAVSCGTNGALAHGSVVLPPAGLTPSNFFYFLDRLGETLQEVFTFGVEAKVKLQLQFAAERVAELEMEVAANGADAKGLEVARQRLADHIKKANDLIKTEEEAGKDIRQISEDFDEDLKELLLVAEEGSDGLLSEIEKMEEMLLSADDDLEE